jgi:hypothetical protein
MDHSIEELWQLAQLFAPRSGVIIGAETPARRTPARRYTLLKGQRRENPLAKKEFADVER